MSRLLKLFLDIALLRNSPAAVPASGLLFALACVALALLEVLASYLPHIGRNELLKRMAISVSLPLLWSWCLLAMAGRRTRFLQTGTALAAVQVICGALLYPVLSLQQSFAQTDPRFALAASLLLVLFVWQLIACAGIWRAALEIGWMLALGLAIAYVPLELYVSKWLLVGRP
jgi:uncharacterized membrane protein (DUF2068 family)